MGTIIARNLIQDHSHYYHRIILSGAPAYQKMSYFGVILANILGNFKSNNHISNFLEKQTLQSFRNAIKNRETDCDWLSTKEISVQNYINDPYCNIPFTISAYKALFNLLINMKKSHLYNITSSPTPILFIYGENDPCVLGEKGISSSIKTLKNAGYTTISKIKHPNMRHEIINERNNDIVYKDILNFIN